MGVVTTGGKTMTHIITEIHVADPTCGCKHGKSVHFKGCSCCKTDFCHVAGCGCLTFTRPRVERVRRLRRRKK